MAPSYSRQLLVFAVPTIAVLLTYFWFKRKRGVKQSDPGESPSADETAIRAVEEIPSTPSKSITSPARGDYQSPKAAQSSSAGKASPFGSPDRSPRVLSTPSTPIDIIIPREHRSHRTSPIVISDEDLDIEIEKVKSMRSYSADHYKLSSGSDSVDASSSRTPAKKGKAKTQPRQEAGDAMPADKVDSSPVKSKSQAKASALAEKKKGKMAAAGASKVEEELSNLNIKGSETKPDMDVKVENKQQKDEHVHNANAHVEERQSSERDSANHSPADVMLASPSLSCISDNHSEGSSDSGKGGSDVATPPSRTPAGEKSRQMYYEFTIPQLLVGKLIGRYGNFVAEIKEKTHAHIFIKRHPSVSKLKLCSIEGSQSDIDNALQMIRDRFPLKKYPEVTLEQVSTAPVPNVPISTDHLYLKLVEGVNNDTVVSCMVSPSHLFLQQSTHPSYPHLQLLSRYMMVCYNNPESPTLPKPILANTICVVESLGEWCRAIILSTDEVEDSSYVTYLDYGGYAVVPNAHLKQIRGDFLLLPFQAAECHLANIRPVGGEDAEWCEEAYKLVATLTKGTLTVTQIAEYTETGIPLVLMYILIGSQQVVFLNDELVKRGFAQYIQSEAAPIQDVTYGDATVDLEAAAACSITA